MFGLPDHVFHAQRLTKAFEARRLTAYDDGAGVLTIGWGHTRNVTPSMRITEREAEELFRKDWAIAESAMRANVKVPVNAPQKAALTMFVFNIGGSAFARSTCCRLINLNRHKEAEEQLDRWENAGGRKMRGLELRRCVERLIWQGHGPAIDERFIDALRGMIE